KWGILGDHLVDHHGQVYLFAARSRHPCWPRHWSSVVCSSDLSGGSSGCSCARTSPRKIRRKRAVVACAVMCSPDPERGTNSRHEIGRASGRKEGGAEGLADHVKEVMVGVQERGMLEIALGSRM